MTDRVVFSPGAKAQLIALYRYISNEASPAIAERFTGTIVARCEALATFPKLGRARDDLRPGLRTLGFERRVLVVYTIEPDAITILAVFYGGRDFETELRDEP